MSQKRRFSLTKKEKAILVNQNPKVGEEVQLTRNHPHISDRHPYLHIDILVFIYEGNGRFEYKNKLHVPISPPDSS